MDWQLSKETVLDRIQTLLKTSQWSDCTFLVEGQIFKAHRLILASCSPVFEAMCFGPLAEKECVVVPDMDPDVFRILLEYIYTDSVKLSSLDEAGGVLYASKKYMMPHLSRICCDYLQKNLRPSYVLTVYEFAEEIQEEKLMEICLKVMCRHTEDVLKSPSHHISAFTMRTLLDQNSLNVSEASLFDAVLQWARVESQQLGLPRTAESYRNVLVKAGVLPKIRFLCLTPQEFAVGPERSGILKTDEICAIQCSLKDIHNSDVTDKESLLKKEVVTGVKKMPNGWSCISQPRGRVSFKKHYCCRDLLKSAVTAPSYWRLLTKIQVDRSVLVSAVRVFSRLVPRTYTHKLPQEYQENIEVSVLNQQGTLLCHTVFKEKVEYNTSITIPLNEPVQFYDREEYDILFTLTGGGDNHTYEYPVGFMTQIERTRGVEFHFCDLADIGSTGAFVRRLDMGFVDALVFSHS